MLKRYAYNHYALAHYANQMQSHTLLKICKPDVALHKYSTPEMNSASQEDSGTSSKLQ
jgi:hypothetical protein